MSCVSDALCVCSLVTLVVLCVFHLLRFVCIGGNDTKACKGRVYSVVYCIRCIVYTLYTWFRCIRRRQAGTVRVRSIAVSAAISLYRALYRGRVNVESAQHAPGGLDGRQSTQA